MVKKGASVTLAVIGILVVAALAITGNLGGLGTAFSVSGPRTTLQAGTVTSTSSFVCQNDGTNDIQAAVRNDLNSSLQYVGPTIAVIDSTGKLLATGTANAGTTLSRATVSFSCAPEAQKGTACALGSGTVVSTCIPYDLGSGYSQSIDMTTSVASNLRFTGRSINDNSNTTQSSNVAGSVTDGVVQAMSTGDSFQRYIDLQGNQTSAAFGHREKGILISIDTVDSAAFTDKYGVVLTVNSAPTGWTLTELTQCPNRAVSANSANHCYTAPQVRTSYGIIRLLSTITNDGGTNAGATSDPIIYFDDYVTFQDTDGKIVTDIKDGANADVGVARQSFTFDAS